MRARVRLVAEDSTGAGPGLQVSLVAVPLHGGEPIALTAPCWSLSVLEAQVEELQQEIIELLGEARELFARAKEDADPLQDLPQSAQELWELMESSGSLEEMKRLFNSLQDHSRRQLADFILGHANVFKGAGALFAQHYDEERGILD